MAVAFRAGSTSPFTSGSTLVNSAGVAVGTNTAAGDYLYFQLTSAVANTEVFNAPSGWTLIGSASNAGNVVTGLWYGKVATSTDASTNPTYTWTWTTTAKTSAIMNSYSGVDSNNPISAFQVVGTTTNTTTLAFPAITPQSESAFLIKSGAIRNGTAALTVSAIGTGYTLHGDTTSTTANPFIQSFMGDGTTVGLPLTAVTPSSTTLSAAANSRIASVVALRPDISGATTLTTDYVSFNPSTSISGITTGYANEVIYMIVTRDLGNPTVTASGGGLTWSSVYRQADATFGSSTQIFAALASTPLTNVTLTLTGAGAPNNIIITCVTFRNADSTTFIGGNSVAATTSSTTVSTSITTTRNNSWVWGAYLADVTFAAPTPGASQTQVAAFGLSGLGDNVSSQRQNAITPTSGTSVTISGTTTGNSNAVYAFEFLPALASTSTMTGVSSITGITSVTF